MHLGLELGGGNRDTQVVACEKDSRSQVPNLHLQEPKSEVLLIFCTLSTSLALP